MKKKRLIIFTKYPEIGKNKTRLIPVLGAKGATELHCKMTEYTINKFRVLLGQENIEIYVYFQGGNEDLMQQWLGEDLNYQIQVKGDLGDKMKGAFFDAFNAKIEEVILIGTDCLGITIDLINQGFDLLGLNYDLIVGKAQDGGYYLIGLNTFIPEVFNQINWGSSQVLDQTLAVAKNLNLNYYLLTELSDLDRPEDLAIANLFNLL